MADELNGRYLQYNLFYSGNLAFDVYVGSEAIAHENLYGTAPAGCELDSIKWLSCKGDMKALGDIRIELKPL